LINILFIAFEFAPLNRGGIYRPLSFAKYLPVYGINPILITLAATSFESVYGSTTIDLSLKSKIPDDLQVVEVETEKSEPVSGLSNFCKIYFSIHGNETDHWEYHFMSTAQILIRQYKPQLILTTIPPFSVLPLVSRLARISNLPLILDFRDAWSQWRATPYGTILHYWLTLYYEKKYLKQAKALITTSKQTLTDFKRNHPEIEPSKFHYIPNGFEGNLQEWKQLDTNKEAWTIGYVGSFYYSPEARKQMLSPWWKKKGHRMLQYIPHRQDWLYRSPYFFFKIIAYLKEKHPETAARLRIKLAGRKEPWLEDMVAAYGLQDQVEHLGQMSHAQSIAFQATCDMLLITSAKQLDGSSDYSIAGKTFEYFQQMRPILAFVCKGAQKEILIEAGSALICDPDDLEKSVGAILGLLNGITSLKPNIPFLESLSRPALTSALAGVIETVINK
jgi:glycosyltransferase involved in cell wall biosynthesis